MPLGTLAAPLNSLDKISSRVITPPVTMVFAMVDGGKQFSTRQRREGFRIHQKLSAMMRSILRQVLAQGGRLSYQSSHVIYPFQHNTVSSIFELSFPAPTL